MDADNVWGWNLRTSKVYGGTPILLESVGKGIHWLPCDPLVGTVSVAWMERKRNPGDHSVIKGLPPDPTSLYLGYGLTYWIRETSKEL